MNHIAIEQILARAEMAKSDSDFTYFFSLLYAIEALAKTIVLGIIASIVDDKDRNRYRLEHQLVRADGLGEWGKVFEDALTGPASQYLLSDAYEEQRELTKLCKSGDWQYEATASVKAALNELGIEAEELQVKTDMKRWFRLFVILRNKTRGHGATQPARASEAARHIAKSIELVYNNVSLFKRPWAYLHRNISGKYRVSNIAGNRDAFNHLKQVQDRQFPNGVYVFMGSPRRISLMHTEPELQDFFFANGGSTYKKYEMLSYCSDNKIVGDGTAFLTPPGLLPPSETEGHGELTQHGNCFSNVPDPVIDYVNRPNLEKDLLKLLRDDKRSIVTLVGRGGIGKTSLALKVVPELYDGERFEAIVWLSARDVDLQLTGPKPVRPLVLSPEDMGKFYAKLVLASEKITEKGFNSRAYLEQQLQSCDLGACLFVFDNFETTQNPIEMFNWIDSFIRLPNKALITTRLREFKGDYPVDVHGMENEEARLLIEQTAKALGISELIDKSYTDEIINHSEGHPYVIKILLGEVSKRGGATNIPHLLAGSEDILTALFERTYNALSPCAQRAFLTLSAWNSAVPRIALESVLYRSTQERQEVEKGIDSLLQYSIAEHFVTSIDKQEFITLPLVASTFGKRKLNINVSKASIKADVEILQMLGPSRLDDIHSGLANRIERFLRNISKRIESGDSYDDFSPVLEVICRAYNPGWLLLAQWHLEERTDEGNHRAKNELERFLENNPPPADAALAWDMMAQVSYYTHDPLSEIHALIERAQISDLPFHKLSNAANKLNQFFKSCADEIDKEQKRDLTSRLFQLLHDRVQEARADDLGQMAWLAMRIGHETHAREYVEIGLNMAPHNSHLRKLSDRLNNSL